MTLYDVDAAGDDVVAFARVTTAVGLGARWPGQVALVRRDGSVVGSLLGGAFDTTALASAPPGAGSGEPVTAGAGSSGPSLVDLEFDHDEAERVGLPCGGRATVLLQPLAAIPHAVREDLAVRRPTVLLTALDDPAYPMRATAPDGDPTYDDEASPDSLARALLQRGETTDAIVETADGRVLVSVLAPTPHLVVIGSGALAGALEAQLALLGWTCASLTTADDGATAVRALGPGDGVLVIDHRGEVDFPILSAALGGGVGYVAALGSRRTQEARRSRLRAGGVDEAAIARLRGPAGLDIGARTPAEIAVAIVAEMVSVRASASGGALRDTTGPINAPRP